MWLGIDASNIRRGGGLTHLLELLTEALPEDHGIERVTVWGGQEAIARLPNRPWLELCHVPILDHSLANRTYWQMAWLARKAPCDAIFAPGGISYSNRKPSIIMSQNALPFEPHEMMRYGTSWMLLRLLILRYLQMRSFKRAAGMLYLTEYARRCIMGQLGGRLIPSRVIPHGVSERFRRPPKIRKDFSFSQPCRALYVSIVDTYKHQCAVSEAVAELRAQGLPIFMTFVGPAYPPAAQKLRRTMNRLDPDGAFLKYEGSADFAFLHDTYFQADVFVFASSCENMPNILLEAMAAGLPIASSDRGPMPEVLGDAGLYFDPESASDIASAIGRLIEDQELRSRVAWAAHERAKSFTWKKSADATFQFITEFARGE